MKTRGYTEDRVRVFLREMIEQKYGSQQKFAEEIGISRTYVNAVLQGKRPINGRLLELLKLRKIVVTLYEDIQ